MRRKRTDEREANKDEDDDDEAIGISIRKTMKKQKILASLPLTSSIPKGKKSNGEDLNQPPVADASTTAAELTVLATKHVRNMEAYIEEKMAAQTNGSSKNRQSQINALDENEATTETTNEEDLYRQLAREVTDSGGDQDQNNNKLAQQQPQNDGDQGDGGAALLVGTGIAEVILPATNHRPVALSSNRVWNKNSNLLSSAVPEGERHKHVLSKTTPKPFVKFRNNNNNNSAPSQQNKGDNHNESTKEENPETSSSAARQGFDAFRGKAPAPDASDEGDKDARNNKHSNNRWKTGKDRDDQVYSHFLKNALNGKRR